MAKGGRESIDGIEDPEIGIDRLMETYLRKGYSTSWINQQLKSIEVCKELTDEWENRGVKKGQEYAIVADEMTRAQSGLINITEFKAVIKRKFAWPYNKTWIGSEYACRSNHSWNLKRKETNKFQEKSKDCKARWSYCREHKKKIEEKTGKKVITSQNARQLIERKDKELEQLRPAYNKPCTRKPNV